MKKVFVSGCYDILHAGHVQFFQDARRLGDHLTVCFASDKVLKHCKGRQPSLPEDNKKILIGAITGVDAVVKSSDFHPVFDFVGHLKHDRPDILAVTSDDRHQDEKRALCRKLGIAFVVLPKRNSATAVSTTQVLQRLANKESVPLRVDFAGGWLDVPKFARRGGYVVNCAISPLVSNESWPYETGSGLGGSAAYAILKMINGVSAELNLGVGWQDPAIIEETGLCVWRSGKKPVLDFKANPDWLRGKMLIIFTGKSHNTPGLVDRRRDYDVIYRAGGMARDAVRAEDFDGIAGAVRMSYAVQRKEGMQSLPTVKNAVAWKYLGGGHGGYALYLFARKKDRDAAARRKDAKIIEPFLKM